MIAIEIDLRSQVLPVRDQGDRPLCLPYAVSSAHECIRGVDQYLAPEYLYHFANDGLTDGCGFEAVSRTLANEGQPMEANCTSRPAHGTEWVLKPRTPLFRRNSISPRPAGAEVFAAIRTHEPPVLGISLPNDFFHPATPWIVEASDEIFGYHAVLGVGIGRYAGEDLVLIRNSWGTAWADGGYAWLRAAFFDKHLYQVMRLTGDVK
jgi:hypothetical protein